METTIIPMSELRDTNAISKLCEEKKEPIYVTKNGHQDMVIMNVSKYDDICKKLLILDLIEKEYYKGNVKLVGNFFNNIKNNKVDADNFVDLIYERLTGGNI